MSNKFEEISIKPGFMKHNGGVLFRTISDTEYEFKTTINKIIKTIIKKYITDFCSDDFNNQSNILFYPFWWTAQNSNLESLGS